MTPIIFCCDPFDVSRPHSMWEDEVKVASSIGEMYLMDHEALLEGKVKKALRRLPTAMESDYTPIVYHGWMMIPSVYEMFYQGLLDKGFKLINSPKEYLGCHHIANWYPVIKEFTPKTVIVNSENIREVVDGVRTFGDSSVIIKDFVSSQKHSWKEACFIPSGNDIIAATTVVATFIGMQKEVDGIQGGVVLREFVPLRSIGTHPKSQMPLSQEFRVFVFREKVISLSRYWEYGDYAESYPPDTLIKNIANTIIQKIGSNFFTIDLAQKEDGGWICIEVGDGQVSSLPDKGNKKEFYSGLML